MLSFYGTAIWNDSRYPTITRTRATLTKLATELELRELPVAIWRSLFCLEKYGGCVGCLHQQLNNLSTCVFFGVSDSTLIQCSTWIRHSVDPKLFKSTRVSRLSKLERNYRGSKYLIRCFAKSLRICSRIFS